VYAYDNNVAANIAASLLRYTGTGTFCPPASLCTPGPAPAVQHIVSVHTAVSPGYVYKQEAISPAHTVDNHVPGGGGLYVVKVQVQATGSLVRWKGVDIWWKRQISPAPAVASLTDVPPSAQFFAEIEAMKDSGITAGCTATTYCPEDHVTRRQMAAFFARALGLYWDR
jgi:hypothetical protein